MEDKTKELLDLASAELSDKAELTIQKKKSKKNLTEVQDFIANFQIRAGEDRVYSYMLYQLYLDYKETCPKRKRKPQPRSIFLRYFAEFFPRTKRTYRGIEHIYYMLDKSVFNLFTEEDMQNLFWKAKKTLRKQREKIIKKKQNQKSKLEETV